MPAFKRININLVVFWGILFLTMSLEGIARNEIDRKKDFLLASQVTFSEASQMYAFAKVDSADEIKSLVKGQNKPKSDSDIQSKKEAYRAYNKINNVALWLMGDENVSAFKSHMIDFGNNNLPYFINKLYRLLIEETYTYPIVIIFIFLILLLLLNVTIVLLVMYFSNNRKNRKERYINIYRNSYEEILSSYLFGEIDWDKAYIKLKRKRRSLNRKILTGVLLMFNENLRGEMDSQISQVFIKLGLQKYALRQLKSVFYHKKIEGMKALTNLDPASAKEIIPDFLNNSHFQVRTEAQVSYVRLHPEQPFEFLKDLISPFPRWTQLAAFHIFRLHQVPVPAFVTYLNSGVPTIRNFSLRMIIFFQQLENASEIYKLLDSPYEMTRYLAIRAVNNLRLFDGKQKIKEMYDAESEKNKLEIVKALKNIGDSHDFDFLEFIIQSGSVSLKLEACRSMYYVNKVGKYKLSMLSQNSDLEIDRYLAHVTDPRN